MKQMTTYKFQIETIRKVTEPYGPKARITVAEKGEIFGTDLTEVQALRTMTKGIPVIMGHGCWGHIEPKDLKVMRTKVIEFLPKEVEFV